MNDNIPGIFEEIFRAFGLMTDNNDNDSNGNTDNA